MIMTSINHQSTVTRSRSRTDSEIKSEIVSNKGSVFFLERNNNF